MPTSDTRDREKARESNVHKPYNPLLPFDKGIYRMLKELYDEVFYIDIQENAFSESAKAHQGKVVLPMITVYRLGDYNIATEMYNDIAVRQGYMSTVRGKDEFSNRRAAIHALPVTLQYQIDVYATRRDVVDGITAELLMEFKERPHFKTTLQDLGDKTVPIEFDFLVDENVTDNSSITEFEDTGRFYRMTLTGIVPSAVIARVDIFNRVEREEITFEELVGQSEEEFKLQNKMSHRPPETIIAESPLDEYGNIIPK